jgi:tRNA-specific 2-thiouridylase
LKEFLKHYIKAKKGKVLNEKNEEVGYHNGAFFYTLGERHGFTITKKLPTDGAYYVVGKDVKKNILVVSTSPQPSPCQGEGEIQIGNVNWIFETPDENKTYTAQIRYHGEFLPCRVKTARQDLAEIIFQTQVLVASGQSCVIYDGDICLGGGVVV